MAQQLKILIVEDMAQDMELIIIQLKKEGFDFKYKWAQNKKEFITEIPAFCPDIILSDYSMPSFTGMDALEIARETAPDTPFIIVTGSLNEEIAVSCIKHGAWDYVIKEAIIRLGPAIRNALNLKDQKQKKRQAQSELLRSEQLYRLLAGNISDMVSKVNLEGEFEFVSPSSFTLLGYEPDEILGKNIYSFIHGDEIKSVKADMALIINQTKPVITQCRFKKSNGKYVWVEISSSGFLNDEHKFSGEILSVTRNIQKRKEEEAIRDAVFNIGQAVVKSLSQKELFAIIKTELQHIFPDSYFHLGLYDSNKQIVEYPSGTMQPSHDTPKTCNNCIINYIIQKNKSIIFSQEEVDKLIKNGEIKGCNPECRSCMGIPLHGDEKVTGGLVVRNPHKSNVYSENDLRLLEFIASQIGLSILGKTNEEKLIRAKEQAEESDRLKSAFLSNMSHEIRTPMNAILGFAELLSQYPLDEEQMDYIARIKESGTMLIKLINDIIDLSKIEAGQLSVDIHTFSIQKLLEDLFISFEKVKNELKKADLKLVMAPIEQDYFIQSDSYRLKQVLSNFLSNAIKYTPKGVITIGAKKTGKGTISFYVKDTGIGILPEKLNSIFERFHKIDNTDTISSGTGLGLAICRSLAGYLEASINVESKFGKGSVFSIDLPFVQSKSANISESHDDQILFSNFKNKSILIVEDDESSYFYIASALKKTGASIIWAMDGDQAIDICKKDFTIDLILMDIRLPKLSGYAATQTIKSFRAELPIIAQTAYAMQGEKQKCFDAGCDDYLAKPILPDDLIRLISKYINKPDESDNDPEDQKE